MRFTSLDSQPPCLFTSSSQNFCSAVHFISQTLNEVISTDLFQCQDGLLISVILGSNFSQPQSYSCSGVSDCEWHQSNCRCGVGKTWVLLLFNVIITILWLVQTVCAQGQCSSFKVERHTVTVLLWLAFQFKGSAQIMCIKLLLQLSLYSTFC